MPYTPTFRSAEELVNRQSLAARERIALEAAHIDNAGVIEAGVEPDERRNARGDLELRSGTLRNAGSLVASRALEAKASQALDNQGGSLKGATVRVDAGHLDNRGGKLLAEGELRVEASSLDNRQDGLLQSRDRAVVKTRGDLDNRGGQVNVGVYGINQGGLGLVSANYDLSYQGNNLTITKALLNVIADAKTKVYGDADPSLTYQVSGLKNGDSAGSILTGGLNRAAGENVGVYGINQGDLALNSGNYDLSYQGNNLTITKALLNVIADGKTKVYGDADPSLTYRVTRVIWPTAS